MYIIVALLVDISYYYEVHGNTEVKLVSETSFYFFYFNTHYDEVLMLCILMFIWSQALVTIDQLDRQDLKNNFVVSYSCRVDVVAVTTKKQPQRAGFFWILASSQ